MNIEAIRINKRAAFIENLKEIELYILKQYPIDWICRRIHVSRDTFKKVFPGYTGSQGVNIERTKFFGKIQTIEKPCERCGKLFVFSGRVNTRQFFNRRFCSNGCAKARDTHWRKHATHYRTICKHNHNMTCIVCGFDKVIDVHHVDGNHDNNDYKNLVPLCPNHHQLFHSKKYKKDVEPYIQAYILKTEEGD
jgi:rubredoxin